MLGKNADWQGASQRTGDYLRSKPLTACPGLLDCPGFFCIPFGPRAAARQLAVFLCNHTMIEKEDMGCPQAQLICFFWEKLPLSIHFQPRWFSEPMDSPAGQQCEEKSCLPAERLDVVCRRCCEYTIVQLF